MVRKCQVAAAIAIVQSVSGAFFSVPLTRKTSPSGSRHILPGHRGTGTAFEFSYEGFWFGNFTIGATADLALLIDTGSADVFLNPGVYKPSLASENLNETFNITFGTTNSNGSGTETISGPIYKDIVRLDGTSLSVPEQALGEAAVPTTPSFSFDGLIGFGSPLSDVLNSTPWFHSLCDQGSLDECRFGLALETDGTGEQYFGKVEHDRFEEPLSVTSLYYDAYHDTYFEWATFGDIAANGKVIERDALIQFDSGTVAIFGPVDTVRALFDAVGVQSVLMLNTTADTYPLLTGYYPCNNPPELGFGFPSITNATTAKKEHNSITSHYSTLYEMLPEALALVTTGNNCTASIYGSDEYGGFLVGQAFFQGRYIDHDVTRNAMGFANLN